MLFLNTSKTLKNMFDNVFAGLKFLSNFLSEKFEEKNHEKSGIWGKKMFSITRRKQSYL